jgi:hypothetical protein
MRWVCGLILGIALASATSCSPPPMPTPTNGEAKAALVRAMRESPISSLQDLAQELATIHEDQFPDYRGSRYHVISDLPGKSCTIMVFFSNRRREYKGEFTRTKDGTWQARIRLTDEIQKLTAPGTSDE